MKGSIMKEAYLKFYNKFSPFAQLAFTKDIAISKTELRKQALLNRLKDYQKISLNDKLLKLHKLLNEILLESEINWKSYDYGEGYFYQGLNSICVTGFRDTDERVQMMDLKNVLKGKSVLEIGCNTGFLNVLIADVAKSIVAFDINPYCVEIGKVTAKHFGYDNIDFFTSTFEDYDREDKFDVVLSFANHSTYDKNTKHTLKEFFDKCNALLSPGGMLLFESQPPEHEGEGLKEVVSLIGEIFEIKEQKILQYGKFLDRNRTYIVATKP